MAEEKGKKMIGSYDIKVPEDTDVTLGYDMTANKVKNFKFSGIWTWIVSKLKGESISDLNTTNKTVVGAIKEVNNPTFTAATSRTNINSGESQSIIMGKVKKWLADLGTAAFCSVVNNLTTTSEGSVLDARQGKNLSDALTKLNTLMGSTDISAIGGGTLTGAINELSSNSLRLDYIDCDINTVANAVIRITSESIIKGKVPEDDNYIPIVHAQSNTNEYEVSIRYDYPSWIVYSNVSQALGIRFFKCTK